MKKRGIIGFLMGLFLLSACQQAVETEKRYDVQSNVISVKDRVKEITLDDKEITSFGSPFILGQYLIMSDYNSPDKLIHIFDKNTFAYLTSIGDRGSGPEEITNMGEIVPNEKDRSFYVIDNGKQKVLEYPIDSVLADSLYKPREKAVMRKTEFPYKFQYINDTLSYALFIKPIGSGDYKPVAAKWNMQTGDAEFMKYEGHPALKRKRVSFAASPEHGRYVEVYWYNDLISLCTLDGNLKCNLYGEEWSEQNTNKNLYFEGVSFCGDKIVASYWGDIRLEDRNGVLKANYPTKFVVFDLDGNYQSTLDLGMPVIRFCYDKDNNRLILAMDAEMQFGYLDLDGLI